MYIPNTQTTSNIYTVYCTIMYQEIKSYMYMYVLKLVLKLLSDRLAFTNFIYTYSTRTCIYSV